MARSAFGRARARGNPSAAAIGLAVVLAALLAVPMAGASTPALAGSWTPSVTTRHGGCGAITGTPLRFSLSSGVERWNGSARAETCRPQSGGRTTLSNATDSAEITAFLPVHLDARKTGVRVVWNLSVVLTSAAAPRTGGAKCSATRNSSAVDYGYTWVNRSSRTQDCFVLAEAALTGSVYLYDRTTGAVWPATYSWPGISNVSGVRIADRQLEVAYSNSTYWSQNYSSSSSSNASFGTNGSVRLSAQAVWYVNGSFTATDRYVLVVSLVGSAEAECDGFRSASASADFTSRGPGLSEVLGAPVVL